MNEWQDLSLITWTKICNISIWLSLLGVMGRISFVWRSFDMTFDIIGSNFVNNSFNFKTFPLSFWYNVSDYPRKAKSLVAWNFTISINLFKTSGQLFLFFFFLRTCFAFGNQLFLRLVSFPQALSTEYTRHSCLISM